MLVYPGVKANYVPYFKESISTHGSTANQIELRHFLAEKKQDDVWRDAGKMYFFNTIIQKN